MANSFGNSVHSPDPPEPQGALQPCLKAEGSATPLGVHHLLCPSKGYYANDIQSLSDSDIDICGF